MTLLLPKRSMLEDFDDLDPLADLSLSDDDFFDGRSKNPTDTATSKKSIAQTDANNKPENHSKKIADLFGLDKNTEPSDTTTDQTAKKDNADWLGLKDSPETERRDAKAESGINTNLKTTETMSESKNKVGGFTISSSLSSDTLQKSRRRSEGLGIMKSAESKKSLFKSLDLPFETDSMEMPKRVSFSDTTKKGEPGDYFGQLDDLDDLLPDTTNSEQHIKDVKMSEHKTSETTVSGSEEKSQTTPKDYVPSAASSYRRPSYGRRRDLETASKTSASLLKSQLDFDFGNTLSSFKQRDSVIDKNFSSIQTNETKILGDPSSLIVKDRKDSIESSTKFENFGVTKDKSQLPLWLTDQRLQSIPSALPETPSLNPAPASVPTREESTVPTDLNVSLQEPKNMPEATESHIRSAISLGEKSLVSEKTIQSLQQTHSQLMSVLKMQQQKEAMDSITVRQLAVLHKQEEQIDQLIHKHLEKQLKAEAIIEKQMQQINDIIQVLISQPDSETSLSLKMTNEQENNPRQDDAVKKSETDVHLNHQILNLEDNIQHLEFENKKLRLQLEFLENRYQLELESVEKNLNYELDMKTKREEKLVKSLEQLEKEYEEKLNKLKLNETELQNSFEEKIDTLQNERMKDFQKLSELQKTILEQTLTFNTQTQIKDFSKLLKPTVFEITKPESEEELSEREAKLLEREKHLASMRDALNRQKLSLETEFELVANKNEALEIEKMEHKMLFNNEMRQVKSDKSMLEIEKRAWRDEKDSDLKQIENLKRQVEVMRESMLKQQETLVQEKLELASERAQINAITKVHGTNLSTTIDLAQAKAEMDGAIEAAKQAEKALDEEKQSLLEKKRQMMNESWKLTEREQEIAMRENFVKQLLEESQRKKEEGLEALKRAKELEKEVDNRRADIQDKINELENQEQNLLKERFELSREWKVLNKNKSQLEFLLPELTNEEKLLLQRTPPKQSHSSDRKLIVYKLPAEREGDGFKPFASSAGHFNFNAL